ncbi:MAG: type II toxin-antitoxin system PemK/MazF family toxin [Mariniphaga sp.]|nr:type II toxin-antitoxin system PemK/MazF family toxin [Mariniphaga sp.]
MKQCEIWLADLNPVRGSEQKGFRPVIILSGNLLNSMMHVVITCPLTTKIKNYKGNVVLTPNKTNGLSEISEAVIFQIRSVSKERLVKKIGEITQQQLQELKQGLNDILRY